MVCGGGGGELLDVGSPAGKAHRSLFWKVEEKVVLLSLNRSASFSFELWQRQLVDTLGSMSSSSCFKNRLSVCFAHEIAADQ